MKPFKLVLRKLILSLILTPFATFTAEMGPENKNAWWVTDYNWPKAFWIGVPLANTSIANQVNETRENISTGIAAIKDTNAQYRIDWNKLTQPHITLAEGSIKNPQGAQEILSVLKKINWHTVNAVFSQLNIIGQPLKNDPKAGTRWFVLDVDQLSNKQLYDLAYLVKKNLLDTQKSSGNFDVKLYGQPENILNLHVSLIRINPAFDDTKLTTFQKEKLLSLLKSTAIPKQPFPINAYKLVITPSAFPAEIKTVTQKQEESNKPQYTAAIWQVAASTTTQPTQPIVQPKPIDTVPKQVDAQQLAEWKNKLNMSTDKQKFFASNRAMPFPIVKQLISEIANQQDKQKTENWLTEELNKQDLSWNVINALVDLGYWKTGTLQMLFLYQSQYYPKNITNRDRLKQLISKLLGKSNNYVEALDNAKLFGSKEYQQWITTLLNEANNELLTKKFGQMSTK